MLPQKLPWELAQTQWASQINPLLNKPEAGSIILKNIALVVGVNVINHRLSRPLQGWNPTRIRAACTIYDAQDGNQTPQLTLVLIASAPAVIDLMVF